MGSFLHKFLHDSRAKSVGRLAFQHYWATRKFALPRISVESAGVFTNRPFRKETGLQNFMKAIHAGDESSYQS